VYLQPVDTLDPSVNVPPLATVVSRPVLLDKLDPVSNPPLATATDRSLSTGRTSYGLARVSRRVTVRLLTPVVKVAFVCACVYR
jgi:hypothetical protein